jgi:hypothetical protein
LLRDNVHLGRFWLAKLEEQGSYLPKAALAAVGRILLNDDELLWGKRL